MHEKNRYFLNKVTSALRKRGVALAAYSEADYEDILKIMDDAEDLPDTYQDWLDLSLETEQVLLKQGYPVTRIMIQPKKFDSWCRINGMRPNAEARAEFAATQAMLEDRLKSLN